MNQTTTAALQQAYQLIKAGYKREARAILLPMLRADQDIADAWYLLGHAVADPQKRLVCFQEVLRLEPDNLSAKKKIARLLAKPHRKHASIGRILGVAGLLSLLLCLILGGGWWLLGSNSQTVAAAPLPSTLPRSPTTPPTHTPFPIPTDSPTQTQTAPQPTERQPAAPTLSPSTIAPTATQIAQGVEVDRLTAKHWREWPGVPTLSAKARGILQSAVRNPALDPHAFSRVGDCQLTTGTFLGGYATGTYSLSEEFVPTVEYFRPSFTTESITASNGLGVNSVLNPIFAAGAGHSECGANETPLDCELRIRRPAVVMVAMGTNWVPHAEVSFEKYLRQVLDRIIQTGALPILATKADNIEEDWKLNQAIAQVAYDYDLPMVNVWRSVQDLPNHGLESPRNIYLTGDAWMRRNHVWLQTLDVVRTAMK